MPSDELILRWGRGRIVLIAPRVVETIERYSSGEEGAAEAGGILIGSYRGPHVQIADCTRPMKGDVRKPFLFDRRDPGHHFAALLAWRSSGRTDTFVGEWHTHPEDYPRPSGMDRSTWNTIMRRAPDPLVFMIAGRHGLWCGIGHERALHRAACVGVRRDDRRPSSGPLVR